MADVIVVTRDGVDGWAATRGGQPVGRLRVLVRPDGRTCLYLREVADDAYAPLVDSALRVHAGDLYVEVDETAHHARDVLSARGFVVQRHEHHYLIPTQLSATGPASAGGRPAPVGFAFVSAAECDVDRLRELDDALRQDVPGAAGWRNDPVRFADQTFADPEFDPATYLVAVAEGTGVYAGLVRVWIRPERPRLGLIGVLPAFRRRGLAVALLNTVFGVLSARGRSEVTCEVDETNTASNALVTGLGARRVGGAVELMRSAELRHVV
ncbi:GNAT family N-acetyltransferase [Virgisporangium aurantiacum]|uniref:Ribosomal-protein-alanine N-acetyltransferase n=1 Tax=Virgisporangium aurantiacum TaxID=175570 RepID=A0A8J3Z3B2_9ACTN|nr:GNAT family N-acetyltransferase [Virgisporangium aurantiacum]GIJ56824.1 ribosomal-protein-alanine N-acetyltransferase [Virgisporangium aurantiacum]